MSNSPEEGIAEVDDLVVKKKKKEPTKKKKGGRREKEKGFLMVSLFKKLQPFDPANSARFTEDEHESDTGIRG